MKYTKIFHNFQVQEQRFLGERRADLSYKPS
jgi:hypothetical protein